MFIIFVIFIIDVTRHAHHTYYKREGERERWRERERDMEMERYAKAQGGPSMDIDALLVGLQALPSADGALDGEQQQQQHDQGGQAQQRQHDQGGPAEAAAPALMVGQIDFVLALGGVGARAVKRQALGLFAGELH